MRLLTLAAGLATGYVLGTRAGRPKYDQIVANARLVRANPTAGQALTAVTNLFGSADGSPAPEVAGTTTTTTAVTPDTAENAMASTADKPARRRPAPTKTSDPDA